MNNISYKIYENNNNNNENNKDDNNGINFDDLINDIRNSICNDHKN